jgi:hypothetical protein
MLVRVSNQISLERSSAQEHTPPLLQVLVLLLAFSYAYLTYIIIKISLERSSVQEHTPPLLQVEN